MKFSIILLSSPFISTTASLSSNYQVDYCSYEHSQHVLDRIESEVKPIFKTYGLDMVQDGV